MISILPSIQLLDDDWADDDVNLHARTAINCSNTKIGANTSL